jgi:hypothetical protein
MAFAALRMAPMAPMAPPMPAMVPMAHPMAHPAAYPSVVAVRVFAHSAASPRLRAPKARRFACLREAVGRWLLGDGGWTMALCCNCDTQVCHAPHSHRPFSQRLHDHLVLGCGSYHGPPGRGAGVGLAPRCDACLTPTLPHPHTHTPPTPTPHTVLRGKLSCWATPPPPMHTLSHTHRLRLM